MFNIRNINKKVVFIILAALVVLGFVVFWYYRSQVFSKEILKLEILGPESALVGEEITYTVKYKNNGNFALENPKIIFELPGNSLTEDGELRFTKTVPDIYPGGQDVVTFKARLLGREGDVKTAQARLSYVPKKLSARYETQTTFTTKIDKVPLTLTYDLPSKVERGKEISYDLNYFSNIDYPLENLSIKIDTISGFNVTSSDPLSLDRKEWKLATLNKAQGGRVTINGAVASDAQSSLHFAVRLGMWVDGTFVVIKEASQDVDVISPQLFISQQINGDSNYIASPGQTLYYQIFIRNIGSSSFDNVFATSALSGSAFDLSTLVSSHGQVQINNAFVAFDPKQISSLRRIAPGQEVTLVFDVKLKGAWTPSDEEKNNLILKNVVTVSGITQEFETKINSSLVLSQALSPIPDGQQVTWQISNYFNDVKNVKVKVQLPEGVGLDDFLEPESQVANFSFDNKTREIVWSVGAIAAGTGVIGEPITLSFQLLGTWGIDSLGKATIFGEDQLTGVLLQST